MKSPPGAPPRSRPVAGRHDVRHQDSYPLALQAVWPPLSLAERHHRLAVGRFQGHRPVGRYLVFPYLAHGAQHPLLGLHVGAHHPRAARLAERYGALLGVGLQAAHQVVAARVAVQAVFLHIEAYERLLLAGLGRQGLPLNLDNPPLAVERVYRSGSLARRAARADARQRARSAQGRK